jgi:hypothetical protein
LPHHYITLFIYINPRLLPDFRTALERENSKDKERIRSFLGLANLSLKVAIEVISFTCRVWAAAQRKHLSLLQSVQTSPGAKPALYQVDIGDKAAGA